MSTTFTPPVIADRTNTFASEEECQQDTMRRIHYWLDVLEERIQTLLRDNDPETMKPGEREQAANRHLILIMRLLSLRQQYTRASASHADSALMDALWQGLEV